MKNLFLVAAFALSMIGLSDESPNYQVKIDWNDKSTLEDNVVLLCDDTYYPFFEIVVPGKPGKDFSVTIDADVTRGTISQGCGVKRKVSEGKATYFFNADGGGCQIRVYQQNAKPGERNKTAVYDISDAC